MITKSPCLIFRTSAPTSSTTPIASCPITRPVSLCSIFLYGHKSLPQTQARVTRMRASVGSMICGSGTFSIRTSPALYMTVAFIIRFLSFFLQFVTDRYLSGTKCRSEPSSIVHASEPCVAVGYGKAFIEKHQRILTVNHQIADLDCSRG